MLVMLLQVNHKMWSEDWYRTFYFKIFSTVTTVILFETPKPACYGFNKSKNLMKNVRHFKKGNECNVAENI